VFIGLRMALKVVNLIVSGIGGNPGVFAGASCKQYRKVELNLSKSKQLSLSESGFSLWSQIMLRLELFELVVIQN